MGSFAAGQLLSSAFLSRSSANGWKAVIADRMLGQMGTPSVPRTAIGLLLALVTIACDTASPEPITVDEFITQIDRLNGQTVNVTGYLGECYVLSCHIYRSKAESDDVDRAMSAMRAALDKGATDVSGFEYPDHPSVSIGPGSQFFDMLTWFYADGYVVVTGKASNRCRSKDHFCFDRVGDLDPVTIRSAAAPS
jgi:hypothetical protein